MPIFRAVVAAGRTFSVEDVHTTALLDEELRQVCIGLEIIAFIDVRSSSVAVRLAAAAPSISSRAAARWASSSPSMRQ